MAGGSDNGSADGDVAPRSRRRGEQLEDAIRRACAAELAECGFGNVTIESVAARAHTGKASIYRRWSTRESLVTDTMNWMLSGAVASAMTPAVGDDISTRDALVTLVRAAVELLTGPDGDVFRALMTGSLRDPGLAAAVDRDLFDPQKQALVRLLHRGAERGETRDSPAFRMVPEMIVGTLLHSILLRRRADIDVEAFVDLLLMPVVEGR